MSQDAIKVRIAVAGRYQERQAIQQILANAQLSDLPVIITASWLSATNESDAELNDEQAVHQAVKNMVEIEHADLLLYFPSWTMRRPDLNPAMPDHEARPIWSPGRLIDYGYALAVGLDILIVGTPEQSIYFRGEKSCTPETLREAIKIMIKE